MSPTVFDAMLPYMTDKYGNPSSIYNLASESRDAIDNARQIIADSIGAKPDEIYFTSGGTESDNWALRNYDNHLNRIVTTDIEHHAILNTCKDMDQDGRVGEIDYLPVDERGFVKTDCLQIWTKDSEWFNHTLYSVMFANNEIGTIEPIKDISKIVRKEKNAVFHVDAVQAFGHIPIDVNEYHIDLMSASGHKLYAPNGIGFLYARKSKIEPYIRGGKQENGKRGGTENVAGIVGLGQAVKEAMEHMEEWYSYELNLREHLIDRVMNEIPNVKLNGDREFRLANNANFSFKGVEGESMIIMLNEEGVCASTGSACSAGNADPSHVLKAIGLTDDEAYSSLRLTVSHNNTMGEIDKAVDILKKIVAQLRSMNSEYSD